LFTWILQESYKIGLSPTIPAWAHDLWFVIMGLLIFVVIALPLIIAVAYLTLWERKILAWAHYRLGPNRAWGYGFLQPLLDAVKLLIKEDIVPVCVDWPVWFLAPIVAFTPMVACFLAIPMSNAFVNMKLQLPGDTEPVMHVFQVPMIAGNLNIGLLFILALSSLVVVGIFMAGWGSNNKYSLFGGMRSAAQIISYEVPVILSLLCVALLAGSLSTVDIVKAQKFIPPGEMKTYLELDRLSISGSGFDYTKRGDYLNLDYFKNLEGDEKVIAAGKLYHRYTEIAVYYSVIYRFYNIFHRRSC
jgi:NADH-quinone oxidoreductase subunit H